MSDLIDELFYKGKPGFHEVSGYQRVDGTYVDSYTRSDPNKTPADNLGTDVDNDGISGAFDLDADGDGILDTMFSDNQSLDLIDSDNDGIMDVLETIGSFF